MKHLFGKIIKFPSGKTKSIKYILLGVFLVIFIALGSLLVRREIQTTQVIEKFSQPLPERSPIQIPHETMTTVSREILTQDSKKITEDIREETVNGTSMQPLITNGQIIRYSHGYYKSHSVERSDIVIAEVAAHSGLIIKRVVGIPGDTWSYSGGLIKINGSILKNSIGNVYNIASPMLKLYSESYPTIPQSSVLILGDQISGTLDASKYGFVSIDELAGKVVEY